MEEPHWSNGVIDSSLITDPEAIDLSMFSSSAPLRVARESPGKDRGVHVPMLDTTEQGLFGVPVPQQYSQGPSSQPSRTYAQRSAGPVLAARVDSFINPMHTHHHPAQSTLDHSAQQPVLQRQVAQQHSRSLQEHSQHYQQHPDAKYPSPPPPAVYPVPPLGPNPYSQTPSQSNFPAYSDTIVPYYNQPPISPVGYGNPQGATPLTPQQELAQAEQEVAQAVRGKAQAEQRVAQQRQRLRDLQTRYQETALRAVKPGAEAKAPALTNFPNHSSNGSGSGSGSYDGNYSPEPTAAVINKRKRGGSRTPAAEPSRARQVYSTVFPRLPSWGAGKNRRPLFQYNEFGELHMHKTYSAAEIGQYLTKNPRPLKLWVQQSPPQMKARLGPNRNKCCWSCCPTKDRVVETGWLRVGFYEYPEETLSGERDPLLPTSQMHLFCFERCFDPVWFRRNGMLEPDDGPYRYPKENPNKTAIDKASDKNIVDQAWETWFDGKVPLVHRRPYNETLSYALTRYHLDCQPPRRALMRDEKNKSKPVGERKTIDYHVGNLMFYLERSLASKRSHYVGEECRYDEDNEFKERVCLPEKVSPPSEQPKPASELTSVMVQEQVSPAGLAAKDDAKTIVTPDDDIRFDQDPNETGGFDPLQNLDVGSPGDFLFDDLDYGQDIALAEEEPSPKKRRISAYETRAA